MKYTAVLILTLAFPAYANNYSIGFKYPGDAEEIKDQCAQVLSKVIKDMQRSNPCFARIEANNSELSNQIIDNFLSNTCPHTVEAYVNSARREKSAKVYVPQETVKGMFQKAMDVVPKNYCDSAAPAGPPGSRDTGPRIDPAVPQFH